MSNKLAGRQDFMKSIPKLVLCTVFPDLASVTRSRFANHQATNQPSAFVARRFTERLTLGGLRFHHYFLSPKPVDGRTT